STGQVHAYRLTVARGDFVHVAIEQHGIDVAAALVGPDGREVIAVDAMDDEFRPEAIVVIADVGGDYTVTARPAPNAGARGRYTIRLASLRPAVAGDEMRVDAERAFARGRRRRNSNDAATWPEALSDFN